MSAKEIAGILFTAFPVLLFVLSLVYAAGYKSRGKTIDSEYKKLRNEEERLNQEKEALKQQKIAEISNLNSILQGKKSIIKDISDREAELDRRAKAAAAYEKVIRDPHQNCPWLAGKFADLEYIIDTDRARRLETKSHPAYSAAREVRAISSEKRTLNAQCKQLQYQLEFYETMFPWLEDFKEIPIQDAVSQVDGTSQDEDYDSVRNWLSPDEYSRLENTHKFQLALNVGRIGTNPPGRSALNLSGTSATSWSAKVTK